jgi:uncharacterized membrane protein
LARWIGVPQDRGSCAVVRMVGLREIASGVGILTRRQPTGWVWARVGGDVMDLALLGSAMRSGSAKRNRVAAATAAVAGVTVLDYLCGERLRREQVEEDRTIAIRNSISIARSPEEVYRFWRDFQNLPRFMKHLESVQWIGDNRTHWKAKGPAGKSLEWDAEITEDRPNERIAWRTLEGSDVDHWGVVRFQSAPGGRGTEVHVELHYEPPAGAIGAALAKVLGEVPDIRVAQDLRRLKQVIEVGEVATSNYYKDARRRR